MEPVRNHRNKLVVEAARLHRARFRKVRRQTIVEGPNLLAEALEAGVTLHTVFSLPADDATASLCSDHDLHRRYRHTGGLFARWAQRPGFGRCLRSRERGDPPANGSRFRVVLRSHRRVGRSLVPEDAPSGCWRTIPNGRDEDRRLERPGDLDNGGDGGRRGSCS